MNRSADAHASPSRVRHRVVVLAVTLAGITYVDRVCIAQAAPRIQEDLGLSASQLGLAFSAFALAYGLFEIPGGWLGDRIGPRKVLMRIVVAWSAFTAATGFAWNTVSLVTVRFLFGVGEAGCFPNLTRAFLNWLPAGERTRAQAVMWLSARWAGALTPLLVIWVMTWLSWRHTFVLFGLLGVVWAVWFHRVFRDRPREHPGVNAAELALIESGGIPESNPTSVPWRRLLGSRTIRLLWVQYFCLAYSWTFYVTWLPTYLKETVGVDLRKNPLMTTLADSLGDWMSPGTVHQVVVAAFAGVPLFVGGLGCLTAGFVAPRLARRLRGVAVARRVLASIGFSGAAVLLVGSFYVTHPLLAILMMGLASFCNDLTMPGSWSTCMDVGGRFAGTVSGSMNMMSAFGAAISPLVIGFLLDQTGRQWALTFWISGCIYALGGLCWWWLDPVTPLQMTNAAVVSAENTSP